ncbi:NAD(P)H-quinone oxidoreductase [Mycobacterium kyogaense]|uniref:NAD(P)H-quinone oxidoreductase n=1 Tax=Mycobacterium kyogaense TaxID=2212479 RepID=UPI001F0963DC|nr:NAD(P)H-quinone oxidoreductase [Mycobacterium kyogaense]
MTSAIVFDAPGGPDVLQWRPIDVPAPGAREVVIAVAAAGVNNADLLQRRGRYPLPPGASHVLGLECAGTVIAVGADVGEWSVGDQVCALLDGGGYAEQVVVAADQLLPIPAGLSLVEAAAVPEVACTVYSNLAMVAGLGAGDAVLVHGAGGGIGTFAVQWARAIGAYVITTAGSDEKVSHGKALGAQTAINYRTEDFVAATLEATDGRGVDAVLDVVGADYLDRNITCLAPDGHLVVIGGAMGPAPLDLGALMVRRASVTATMLRGRPAEQKAAIVAGVRRDVWPLFEAGAIRVVVDTEVPLRDAARGHELLESGRAVGKVVLTNND